MSNTNNDSPEFKDKTEALEFMVKRSIDRKRKEKWAKEFAAGRKKNEGANVVTLPKRLIRISAIAAILVLCFLVVQIIPFGNENLDSLATNMIETTKFRPSEMTRGEAILGGESNGAILKALESENYTQAITLYQEKNNSLTPENKFFYAVSLAKTNNSDTDKILVLTKDLMQTESEFLIESLWISALTHIKLKDTETAKAELTQLLRYKYQTKNVEKLLSKISANN